MSALVVLKAVLIVGLALALCLGLIWVFPPKRFGDEPLSLDSKRKFTWLACVGCAIALIFFLIAEYKLAHISR